MRGNARHRYRRLTRPLKRIPTALRHDRGHDRAQKPGVGEFRGVNMGVDGTPGSGRALRLDPFALPVRYAARDGGADGQIRQIELDRERVVLRRAVRGIRMKVGVPVNEFRGVDPAHAAARGRRAGGSRGRAGTSRQRAVGAAVRRGRRRRRDGAMEMLGPRARRAAAGGRGRRRAARAVPAHRPRRRRRAARRAGGGAPRSAGAGRRS